MNEQSQSDLNISKIQAVPTHPNPPEAALDPFDPTRLRLSPKLGAGSAVKKMATAIPVRKPSKEWFVRCHPDESYRLETYVLELKEENETYLVVPELWDYLGGESTFSPRLLLTAINTLGTLFIWPIRLPNPDGRRDNWSKSAIEAVNYALKGWVRVQANMNAGSYDVFAASGNLVEPEWPTMSFKEIMDLAFRDHRIDSLDHPVLKRLRGEA